MSEEYIEIREEECLSDTDESGVFFMIPVSLVISRLPRGKAVAYTDQPAVEEKHRQELEGVNWQQFANLNLEQTKGKKRSLAVYDRFLSDIAALNKEFGTEKLNIALSRVWAPEKANIAYVRAILKNGVEAKQKTSPAEGAWNDLLAALGNMDQCYKKEFPDPKVQISVRAMGGWDVFRGISIKQVWGMKKDFYAAYYGNAPDSKPKISRPAVVKEPPPPPAKFQPVDISKYRAERSAGRKQKTHDPESVKTAIRMVLAAGDERGIRIFQKEYPALLNEVSQEVPEWRTQKSAG